MTVLPVVITLGLQGWLLLLDLFARPVGEGPCMPPAPCVGAESTSVAPRFRCGVHWRALLFLLAVTGVYFAIQVSGDLLVPSPQAMLARANEWLSMEDLRAVEAGRYDGALGTGPAWLQSLLLYVVTFFVAGFWDYWIHRVFSHNRWLFVTHEYHHLPRQVTVAMPGILVRPFAFLTNGLTALGTVGTLTLACAALGRPLPAAETFVPAGLAIVLVLTASHSRYLRRFGWVHFALTWLGVTSPQAHLLHHGVGVPCNYANFAILWDRLFGTYVSPEGCDLEKLPLGLPYDQDFLGALTGGAWKLPAAWRRNLELGRYCRLAGDGAPLANERDRDTSANRKAQEASPARDPLAAKEARRS